MYSATGARPVPHHGKQRNREIYKDYFRFEIKNEF